MASRTDAIYGAGNSATVYCPSSKGETSWMEANSSFASCHLTDNAAVELAFLCLQTEVFNLKRMFP